MAQETELELLTLMSATGAAERMVSNTAGATVTAQALSLNTSSMADGFIRVQADNSSLEVLVPASALTGLEGQNPVMLLSAFHDEQPNWDANPDSQPAMDGDLGQKALAGAPVGITIAASGAVLKITNLQDESQVGRGVGRSVGGAPGSPGSGWPRLHTFSCARAAIPSHFGRSAS